MVVLGRGQHSHILVYILYPSTRIVIISYSIYDIWAQGGKAFGALFVLLPPTRPTKGTCGKVTRDRVLSQVHSSKRLSCRSPVTLDGCRLLSQLGGARLEATLHISLNRPKDVQVECTGLDRLDRAGCLGKREVSHLGHGMSRWPQPKKHAVSKLAYHV